MQFIHLSLVVSGVDRIYVGDGFQDHQQVAQWLDLAVNYGQVEGAGKRKTSCYEQILVLRSLH